MNRRRSSLVLWLVAWSLCLAGAAPPRVQTPSAAPQPADGTGLAEFGAAVERYVALQRKLTKEVGDLVPQSTAQQITATSDRLAAAIRRARPNARQGDFFNASATKTLKSQIAAAIQAADLGAFLANIDDEPGPMQQPRVHLRWPAAAPLATMPPSLLHALPVLPHEMEYRIIGEYLVLRDVKAGLILDYINAVPRGPR
jgi:hypothetical protein